jgi:hypothetical protein
MRFCVLFRDLGLEKEQILLHDTRFAKVTIYYKQTRSRYTGELVNPSGISELFGTEVPEGLTNFSVYIYMMEVYYLIITITEMAYCVNRIAYGIEYA